VLLPVLYRSPTIEVGIDIWELNAVHAARLANYTPFPACGQTGIY